MQRTNLFIFLRLFLLPLFWLLRGGGIDAPAEGSKFFPALLLQVLIEHPRFLAEHLPAVADFTWNFAVGEIGIFFCNLQLKNCGIRVWQMLFTIFIYIITILHWLSIYTSMKHSLLQISFKIVCTSLFRHPVWCLNKNVYASLLIQTIRLLNPTLLCLVLLSLL